MTLLATFCHPVADTQQTFRRISKAMSEPGVMVSLPALPAWGRTSPAATAVLMTLVGRETPLWIDTRLHDDALLTNLRFHTGAAVTTRTDAPFALLHGKFADDIAHFSQDDTVSSEKSSTLIIDVKALSGGLTLRLRGPGLREPRAVAPMLPESVVKYLRGRAHTFPQGIDLLLTCGENMMALPRTVNVEVC